MSKDCESISKIEDYWENKYVTKTYKKPTLNGAIYTYIDKFGAVLYLRNSFGECQRIYSNEKEYLRAINLASTEVKE